MNLYTAYILMAALTFAGLCLAGWMAWKEKAFRPFSTRDLATLALMICVLYAVMMPWAMGLSHIPGLDSLVYAIPYSLVLILTVILVPRPGAATMLICGEGILGQLLMRGINPVWWPYYLLCALAVELVFLVLPGGTRSTAAAFLAGMARAIVSCGSMYWILMPLLWHQHFAVWYVVLKMSLSLTGSIVGVWIALRSAPAIGKAARFTGI